MGVIPLCKKYHDLLSMDLKTLSTDRSPQEEDINIPFCGICMPKENTTVKNTRLPPAIFREPET
jgi:hypothetical protein